MKCVCEQNLNVSKKHIEWNVNFNVKKIKKLKAQIY